MIDFIKGEIINVSPQQLLENPLLEFIFTVNSSNGVCGKWLTAYFKGLKFKIYDGKDGYRKIIIEGSLHKYKNDGLHNFDDFNRSNLDYVLLDIYRKFNISPCDIILTQLEIGVNITPPVETIKILNACIFHKTSPFKWIFTKDEGNYIQVQHNGYYVKIYDKQKHYNSKGYNIPTKILRFEIKYKREKLGMDLCQKTPISLHDILSFRLSSFQDFLTREWLNILYFDSSSVPEDLKSQYSNPYFWQGLNYEQFKYNRKKLNLFISNNPSNIRDEVLRKIKEKTLHLSKEFPELKLYI